MAGHSDIGGHCEEDPQLMFATVQVDIDLKLSAEVEVGVDVGRWWATATWSTVRRTLG